MGQAETPRRVSSKDGSDNFGTSIRRTPVDFFAFAADHFDHGGIGIGLDFDAANSGAEGAGSDFAFLALFKRAVVDHDELL